MVALRYGEGSRESPPAAILVTDVVGYSRLMEHDEAGTLNSLKALRSELIYPTVADHQGRVVKLMGDGALIEFASVIDAVDARLSSSVVCAHATRLFPPVSRSPFALASISVT
jgi:class 3 adenylate cyclase